MDAEFPSAEGSPPGKALLGSRIRTEPAPRCPVCQEAGETFYPEVTDRVWVAPGTFAYRRCRACEMLWLDPRPAPADLRLLYPVEPERGGPGTGRGPSWFEGGNGTRGEELALARLGYGGTAHAADRGTGGLADRLVPWRKEAAERALMHVRGPPEGRLLDIGCGDGAYLSHMQHLGWSALGTEVEPRVAARARERRALEVLAARAEALPLKQGSVRVITMHHVLDHLHDPSAALRSCHAALSPGGRLVIVSPNGEGEGHRRFRDAWVNLDPPRHLFIFSPRSLRLLTERAGFHIQLLRTSALRATAVHFLSEQFRRTGRFPAEVSGWKPGPSSRWFGLYERAIHAVRPSAGEEIVLVATR